MNSRRFVIIAALVGLSFTGVGSAAAQEEALRLADFGGVIVPVAPLVAHSAPILERPAILPALYVTLGVMQAWDIYSTRAAINAGAREANPSAAPFSRNTASMLGLKAATTVSTLFFAERMWKKNRVGAVVMLIAINGATAAVSMHNMRNVKRLSTR